MLRSRHFVLTLQLTLLSCVAVQAQNIDGSADQALRSEAWTAHGGLGSSKAWNFVGLSKDFWRTEHLSLYASAGLGTILVGAGAAYYTRRTGDGFVLSATAGVAGAHASVVYQLGWDGAITWLPAQVMEPTFSSMKAHCRYSLTKGGSRAGEQAETTRRAPHSRVVRLEKLALLVLVCPLSAGIECAASNRMDAQRIWY